MPVVEIRRGDILSADEKYIAHQCNCVSTGANGLAAAIFATYPEANTYASRIFNKCGVHKIVDNPSTPGNISTHECVNDKIVVNMYAQYAPGRVGSRYSHIYKSEETCKDRVKWFQMCLAELEARVGMGTCVAMPHLIGCGKAGGDFKVYLDLLNSAEVDIVLYVHE